MPNSPSGRLWAVTSYYNPVPYRRRLTNYRIFRERLRMPLVTVELVFGAAPELGPDDADILVQLRGHDVMWQKERLLNIAVGRLPATCDKVAWLDCDVILADPDWPQRIERMLDAFPILQGFSRALHLGPEWLPGMPADDAIASARASACKAIADGLSPRACFYQPFSEQRIMPHSTGYAWAARRDLLEAEGLYDAAIIGGGDRLLAGACYGCFGEAADRYGLQGPRLRHYADWAMRWDKAVAGSVGVLDGDVLNLWHGEILKRRYTERQLSLNEFGFDPYNDIALDAQDVWRWNSDKPALHAYVREYFASRQEDG